MLRLVVISNPVAFEGEATLINELFIAGLECLHLRKPGINPDALALLLQEIEPRFYGRIALHQCHELAKGFGITRLHFTETARRLAGNAAIAAEPLGVHTSSGEYWQQLHDEGYTVSTSLHDLGELSACEIFDYVFYGPVFNSISKAGYNSTLAPGFKLGPAAGVRAGTLPEIIAVGGIEISNLLQIKEMGFAGAALLGTLWLTPEKAVERFTELKELTNDQ